MIPKIKVMNIVRGSKYTLLASHLIEAAQVAAELEIETSQEYEEMAEQALQWAKAIIENGEGGAA